MDRGLMQINKKSCYITVPSIIKSTALSKKQYISCVFLHHVRFARFRTSKCFTNAKIAMFASDNSIYRCNAVYIGKIIEDLDSFRYKYRYLDGPLDAFICC